MDKILPLLNGFIDTAKEVYQWAVDAIAKIREFFNLGGGTVASSAGVTGYATGTDYVPETGIYLLHEGEAVIPAAQNNGSVGTGGSTIIQNYSGDIVLPNVTNYDEFRASMARDMRMDRAFRGVS